VKTSLDIGHAVTAGLVLSLPEHPDKEKNIRQIKEAKQTLLNVCDGFMERLLHKSKHLFLLPASALMNAGYLVLKD